MTPTEFKQARHTLGLSVSELANILNTETRTVRRWEDGTRQPNPVAVRVMGWLMDGTIPLDLATKP